MIFPPLKFQNFGITVSYIHFSVASFSFLLKQKSLSSFNLSLFLHDVSTLWLEPDISGTSSLYFPHTWETNLEGARTLVQSWHFLLESFQKSILDVWRLISVPLLCNLKHIKLSFILNSMKSSCKQLISFRTNNVC